MAGSKLKVIVKVPASTVLEMVIAMVIIVMVLGIALTIFANVTRSSLSAKQLRAQAVLDKAMLVIEHQSDTIGLDSLAPTWKLRQEVQAYGGEGRLQQVHLILLDENLDTITQLRKVMVTPAQRSATP